MLSLWTVLRLNPSSTKQWILQMQFADSATINQASTKAIDHFWSSDAAGWGLNPAPLSGTNPHMIRGKLEIEEENGDLKPVKEFSL